MLKTLIVAGLVFLSLPAFAEAPKEDREAICKLFAERAAPDYVKSGVEGIVDRAEKGLQCIPLVPVNDAISEEELQKLREMLVKSCIENKEMTKEKIDEMLATIPEGC